MRVLFYCFVYTFSWSLLTCRLIHAAGKGSGQRHNTFVTTKYFKDINCGELVPNTKQIGPEYCHVLNECFPLGGTSYYGKYQYHPRIDNWSGQMKEGTTQDGYDTFIMSSYLDSNCLITNVQTPASIMASNCPPGTCCPTTLIHGSQAVISYFIFEKVDACPLGDQLNESIFLPPFSVIFEQSKTFNFWEFVEFFLLILSGWMIGVIATHYYYFGFASSRKLGYKEVPMNDLSSDEEGHIAVANYIEGARNITSAGMMAATREIKEMERDF